MTPKLFAWACAAALVALPLAAQVETRVLQGRSVTEANVLDALTPVPEGVTKRSLKVGRDRAEVSGPPRRASASLLITFETNSADLTPMARQQLEVVAAALVNDRLSQYRFAVEGHADPRGDPEANMLLSQQRADSVRKYLVGVHGIEGQRLISEGKGDREPLNRATPAAAENRRVTFVTLPH